MWLLGFLLACGAVQAQPAPNAEVVDQEWRERFVLGYFGEYFRHRTLRQKEAKAELESARARQDLRAELRAAARFLLLAETDDESCDTATHYLRLAQSAGPAFEREWFDLNVATAETRSEQTCEGRLPDAELARLADRLGDRARIFFVLQSQHASLRNAGRDNDRVELFSRQMQFAIADFQLAACMIFLAQIDLVVNPRDNKAREWLNRAEPLFSAEQFPGLQARLDTSRFRLEQYAGNADIARKHMAAAMPAIRQGVMGARNSAMNLAIFARAANGAGQIAEARTLLAESRQFDTANIDVRRTRSLVALEILTREGTPEAYAKGLIEVDALQALLPNDPGFKPRETRTYRLAISAFHERFGNYSAALASLKQANQAGEEFQRRTSEAVRVELQEKLNVTAQEAENARLKAAAELQAANQRAWILAFSLAALGVTCAGAALAVAVRRGRRLASVSAELAQRNSELEQRSASRIQLLAAACHDLRQPAHALGLLAELGTDAHQEPSRFADWLQGVRRSATTLREMLDQLMDLGRLDGGHYVPQPADVALADVLHDVRLQFGEVARRKGLVLDVPPTSLNVQSDRHLLRRIIFNLVSNAIKYTDTGVVRVIARATGEAVEVVIADTGPGIPDDKLEDVFRDYVRLNPTKAAEGLGIGLSIVRRAADLLGHPLTLTSAPGEGTTATLRLRTATSSRGVELKPASPDAEPATSRVLVLLEDDADVRGAMAAVMRRWGYTVLDACDAPALLADLGANRSDLKPALLITDLHLGARNGLDDVALLREALQLPELPALLVTGDMDATVAAQAAQAGICMAHKPLAPSRLSALLQQLLGTPVPAPTPP